MEDPALHSAQASLVIANGLRFASIPFNSDMPMHDYLNITDGRLHRACTRVSLMGLSINADSVLSLFVKHIQVRFCTFYMYV